MIFGSVINDNLKDEIIVTVIATGFNEEQLIPARPVRASVFGASTFTSTQVREQQQQLHEINAGRTATVPTRT